MRNLVVRRRQGKTSIRTMKKRKHVNFLCHCGVNVRFLLPLTGPLENLIARRNEVGKLEPWFQFERMGLLALAEHPIISNSAHAPNLPTSWGTLYEVTKMQIMNMFIICSCSGLTSS